MYAIRSYYGRHAGLYLGQGRLAERRHPLGHRELADVGLGAFAHDKVAHLLVERQDLEDPGPAAVSRPRARRASFPPVECELSLFRLPQPDPGEVEIGRFVLDAALRTDDPHQTLGHDSDQSGGDEIGWDPA